MTPTNRRLIAMAVLLVVLVSAPLMADTAATHKHEHSHTHNSRERLADGSYAPRDIHHQHADEEDSDEEHHHSNEFDHEAILGSVRTAEEFDQLKPAEAKKRLAVLVREMDLNHDGFIDRHELKAWILRSFRQLAEEEAAERRAEVDQNLDGYVTWQEYILETYNMNNESDTNRLALSDLDVRHIDAENGLIQDDWHMFNAADTDADQRLSTDEFVAFTSPEEFAHMLPVVLAQTLREKDKNADGKIDFQEFVGESAASHDKEWLVAEKEKFDVEHDLDGDGTLNGNEILSWVVPSNE